MVEIVNTIRELTDRLVGQAISKDEQLGILEELEEIEEDYSDIEQIVKTILLIKAFYKEPSYVDSIRYALEELMNQDIETLILLSDLGLKVSNEVLYDIEDLLDDKQLKVKGDSHGLFKKLKGDYNNIISIELEEDEIDYLRSDLIETSFSKTHYLFTYSLIEIKGEIYVIGVSKIHPVILMTTLRPLKKRYRIKNRRKVNKTTYKGLVFPEYTGVDMHIKEEGIILDREFLMGASMFLDGLGVRLS